MYIFLLVFRKEKNRLVNEAMQWCFEAISVYFCCYCAQRGFANKDNRYRSKSIMHAVEVGHGCIGGVVAELLLRV